MEKLLAQLVERVQKVYGERLVSLVLYGSAASGEYHEKFSDLNILCVLSEVTPRELAEGEETFKWWRELGNPAPLLLTEVEITESADCFTLEFRDIHRQHRILFGKDVISSLTIDESFYRAQVEHELRSKLLRLRQKAAGMLSDADLSRRLLIDSVSTFCVLFRHALALAGDDSALTKRDAVERARGRFGIDAAPFQTLLDIREGRVPARNADVSKLLGPYLDSIGRVIAAVNALERRA